MTFVVTKSRVIGLRFVILSLAFYMFSALAYANSGYYRHVIFDNSMTSDSYFYSTARASGQSFLEQKERRLPVETKTFLTPPNAIRLTWQSAAGGGWIAQIRTIDFRNRFPQLNGTDLYFWIFAPEAIAAADLPKIVLSNAREGLQVAEFPGSFSQAIDLAKYTGAVPAGRWVQVRIPLSDCKTASIHTFKPEFTQSITFYQGRPDNVRHTLIVDEIRIDNHPSVASLPTPSHLRATGSRHSRTPPRLPLMR